MGQKGAPDLESSGEAFAKELELQRRLADAPWLLPGVERGPVAVAKEVRVSGAGRADVVVVDAVGAITVVECKRAANSKFRRWVIGQTLSYAAALWQLAYKDFDRSFAAHGVSLTAPFQDLESWSEETFRDAVNQNLKDGSFRLVIAVDAASEELRRTVVYLNSQTLPEVEILALEVPDADTEEPLVFGRESDECGPLQPEWGPDRWTLLEGIESLEAADVAEALLDWVERQSPRLYVKHEATYAAIKVTSGKRTLFRLADHRAIRVSFSALGRDEARIARLRADLLEIDSSFVGDKPQAPLEVLSDEGKLSRFLDLMQRSLDDLQG